MKVGDLVKLKNANEFPFTLNSIGVIIDLYEDDHGFEHYKVAFEHEVGWIPRFNMELMSESKE